MTFYLSVKSFLLSFYSENQDFNSSLQTEKPGGRTVIFPAGSDDSVRSADSADSVGSADSVRSADSVGSADFVRFVDSACYGSSDNSFEKLLSVL